jgi:hypothetical protein
MSRGEHVSLIDGHIVNRRRHALTAAWAACIGAIVVMALIVSSNTVHRTTTLVQASAGVPVQKMTAAQRAEKEYATCVASFGLLGAFMCLSGPPSHNAAHKLMSKELPKSNEVVHNLAPVSQPVKASVVKSSHKKAIVNSNAKSASQAVEVVAPVAQEAVTHDSAVISAQNQAAETPIDCACCHSKCQKSGLYKDPKKRAVTHSTWCVKQVLSSPRNMGLESLLPKHSKFLFFST